MRYYTINKNGKIKFDRAATFINNNEWYLPLILILSTILVGIVEAM